MSTINATLTQDGQALSHEWADATRIHERWLRTVIAARLGECQAIDEVMQEVHLAAVRQRMPFSEVREVSAWLYRLAIRHTLLYRRKQGRQSKLLGRFAERVGPNGKVEPEPLAWLLADERAEMVRRAMAQMHRRDSEILMLKYTENWSYRDLANHLGLSESAVESRLHRARQRLRDCLSDKFDTD